MQCKRQAREITRAIQNRHAVLIFNIQFSQTNVLIGPIVPREFRLHDNKGRPCDITVHEIFIARQNGGRM